MNSILSRANTRLNNVIGNTAAPALAAPIISSSSTSFILPVIVVLLIVVIILIAVFYKQIMNGINSSYDAMRSSLGATNKQQLGPSQGNVAVLDAPEAPQDEKAQPNVNLVDKVLPGRQEVFNVSENHYTYYDAEPLCKALGAELATYDQIKESWDKGGDWCNYGWTKGQLAVYPTQSATWEKLQSGPEEQRRACGRPGLNGGHFDNPELRFGVNCYGVKPAQSKHDADKIAKRDGQPLTPGALEFDKKVSHFRSEADHVGVLPFNNSTWDSP